MKEKKRQYYFPRKGKLSREDKPLGLLMPHEAKAHFCLQNCSWRNHWAEAVVGMLCVQWTLRQTCIPVDVLAGDRPAIAVSACSPRSVSLVRRAQQNLAWDVMVAPSASVQGEKWPSASWVSRRKAALLGGWVQPQGSCLFPQSGSSGEDWRSWSDIIHVGKTGILVCVCACACAHAHVYICTHAHVYVLPGI